MENDFFFPPYEGDKYADADNFFNGKKVLVVGHALYCTGKDKETGLPNYDSEHGCGLKCRTFLCPLGSCPNKNLSWTEDVVRAYINFQKTKFTDKSLISGEIESKPTYTKFAKLFLKYTDYSPTNFIKIWRSLIFYNFSQTASPTTEGKLQNYDDAKLTFLRFLNYLQKSNSLPDLMIVWGDYIPNYLPFINDIKWQDNSHKSGYIEYGGKNIAIALIKHPRGGFYDHNTKVIKSVAPELFPTNI